MPIDWQAIGAVATFLAVAVSLYLGLGIRKKLLITESLTESLIEGSSGEFKVTVTVTNVGNTPIAITNYGFKVMHNGKPGILDIAKKYSKSKPLPLVVKAGCIELIQFELNETTPDEDEREAIFRFKKSKFVIQDSTGKYYPRI